MSGFRVLHRQFRHECPIPTVAGTHPGDVGVCDECGKVWHVVDDTYGRAWYPFLWQRRARRKYGVR